MREVKLYLPAFISLGLMVLLVLAMANEMQKKKNNEQSANINTLLLELEEDENCSEIIPYAKDISTFCLKEIYYLDSDDKKTLRSILNKSITMDDIINKMALTEENLYYEIYTNPPEFSNVNFKILKCNNKYIIGTSELYFDLDYCK